MVDNLIRLFDSAEVNFSSNGIGVLKDAESCFVIEERNGEFELEMTYPITGKWFSEIQMRRIIVAKSNPYSNPQPFRIYSISKPFNGIVKINAEHISYDMSGYPVPKFQAKGTAQAIFDAMKAACPVNNPFLFWSNRQTIKEEYKTDKPLSMRSILGGVEGSVLSSFGGGEYEFDCFTVKFYEKRGEDNGVVIRYGKNLTDIEQEENCSSVYTGVYPYWYSDNGNKKSTVLTLEGYEVEESGEVISDGIIRVDGNFNYTKILTLDLSDKFDNKPKKKVLYEAAKSYIKNNEIGVPKVSLDISFEQLAQYEEYETIAKLEEVKLCDTVHVEFPELEISAMSKCIKTEYDVLTDKYKRIELGSSKSNLASTIADQSAAINSVNQTVYGNSGGYVIMHSTQDNDIPDELLIMDSYVIEEAKKVWRWNIKGLSYSGGDNAYYAKKDSDYEVAITMDGKINASFIKTGTLESIEIKCGQIQNGKHPFSVTSDGELTATKGTIAGFEINDKAIFKGIDSFESNATNGIYLGTDGIRLGSTDSFSVDLDGKLIAKSGVIGGLTLGKESREMIIDGKKVSVFGSGLKSIFDEGFSEDFDLFSYVYEDISDNNKKKHKTKLKVSSIEIDEPIFNKNFMSTSMTGSTAIKGGNISLKDSWIMDGNDQVIWLTYSSRDTRITAELSNSWDSKRITINLKDSNNIAYKVKSDTDFSVMVHYTWGDWITTTITVKENNSSGYVDINNAFWGFDDAKFVNSGTKEYYYYVGTRKYVDFKRNIEPYSNNIYDCGSSDYAWKDIFSVNALTVTSDRNKKKDIELLTDKYDKFFDTLKPVTYKFIENNSNRTHIGFIAQDVKQSLDLANIDSKDFAGYCAWTTTKGQEGCGLRYEEFIALNTYEIQKLKNKVNEVERLLKINKLIDDVH